MDEKVYNQIQYKICGLDRVVDEKGSCFIALRKLQWGDPNEPEDPEKVKLDLRKYYSNANGGSEKLGKGVSFLTEEGPHELAKALLESGYGHTEDVLNAVKDRGDFKDAVESVFSKDGKKSSSKDNGEFFDPRKLLLDD